jgi:hypothetical protein
MLLPIAAVAAFGLSACDTKVGTAAVVNGSKISEVRLNDYLTPSAKPISASDGSSVPARQFVLSSLIRDKVFVRLLDVTGGQPKPADLTKAETTVLQGTTTQELNRNIVGTGLDASFTPSYLHQLELLSVLSGRITSDAQLNAAMAKAKLDVSVSPRYGTWNPTALTLAQLSKKQVAGIVTLDGALPGDAVSAQ